MGLKNRLNLRFTDFAHALSSYMTPEDDTNVNLMPRYAPGKWAVVHCPTCLDNVTLLPSVLGSGNNKLLTKESNAPASNGLKKNREEEGR